MRIVSVYIAARYSRKQEMRGHRETLNKAGIHVTSHWIDEMGDPQFTREIAQTDIEDINKASALLFFAGGGRRGGLHVEFGYALANFIPIYVIGSKENVFHYLHGVSHFDTLEAFLEAAK